MTSKKIISAVLSLIAVVAWSYGMTRPDANGNSPAELVGLIAVILSLVAMFWPEKKKIG